MRYRLLKVLGRGRYGLVHEGISLHHHLGKRERVAVKVVSTKQHREVVDQERRESISS